MKKVITFLSFLAIFMSMFGVKSVKSVGNAKIVISEIYPDPSAGQEYVEIYNASDETVVLTGYSLYDVSSPVSGACDKEGLLKNLDGELAPGQWLVITLLSSRLNNDGDKVVLKDSSGIVLDVLSYGVCGEISSQKGYTIGRANELSSEISRLSPTPGGKNYLLEVADISFQGEFKVGKPIIFSSSVDIPEVAIQSIVWELNNEKIAEDTWTVSKQFEKEGHYIIVISVSDIYGNTESKEFEFDIGLEENPLPVDYTGLFISEIFPSPSDGNSEWVELYNSSTRVIDLSGAILDDIENGGSSPYTIPEGFAIRAGEWVLLTKKQTEIAFNNTGDSVILKGADNSLIDKVDYPSIPKDNAYALIDGEWRITDIPTPGEANTGPSSDGEEIVDEVTIADAKTRIDQIVKVTGVVTASTNEVGIGIAYIHDETGGIRIKISENILCNQIVSLTGKVREAWGEVYIQSSHIEIMGTGSVTPKHFNIEAINANSVGELIQVDGDVSRVDGLNFWIHGSGEVKVYLSSSLGWKRPGWIKKGVKIRVIGILSQWGFDSNGEPNLRILPRNTSDLLMLSSKGSFSKLPDTYGGLPSLPGFISLIGGLTFKLIYTFVNVKAIKQKPIN